jgi:hypothetical protein
LHLQKGRKKHRTPIPEKGKQYPLYYISVVEKVPVTFTYQGKTYSGHLSQVHGSGQRLWHLMVNNFYWGNLTYVNGWVFHSNSKPELSALADHFGDYITAWYQ